MQYVHDMHLRLHSGTTDFLSAEAVPRDLFLSWELTHAHAHTHPVLFEEPLSSKWLEKAYNEQRIVILFLGVVCFGFNRTTPL